MSVNPLNAWANAGDPLYVPAGASISTPSLSVSSINGYTFNPWWNLQTYNQGTVVNRTANNINQGSGLVQLSGANMTPNLAGNNSYYCKIPANFTIQGADSNADTVATCYVGFSTGNLRLVSGSLVGHKELPTTQSGGFEGILDCPTTNAPLVFFASTQDSEVASFGQFSPQTGTFFSGKIGNIS